MTFNLAMKRLGSYSRFCLQFPFRTTKESKTNYATNVAENTEYVENVLKKDDPTIFHISDEKVADLVINNLRLRGSKNVPILEINPGPGVLTKKLLNENIGKVFAVESRTTHLPLLKEMQNENDHKLKVIPGNFFKWRRSKLDFQIKISEIKQIPWNEDISMRIVGLIPPSAETRYLRGLCAALSNFEDVFRNGRCEFYFFISEKEYKYMTAQCNEKKHIYMCSSVLYQAFFDMEFIDMVPNTSFEPKLHRKPGKRLKFDNTISWLVKLVPKLELSISVPPEQHHDLYFFIKQNFTRSHDYVIANFERWIPNCGPRLIKMGIPIFTKFGNLPPNMIVELFKEFSSWPEYTDSAFRDSSNKDNFFAQEVEE